MSTGTISSTDPYVAGRFPPSAHSDPGPALRSPMRWPCVRVGGSGSGETVLKFSPARGAARVRAALGARLRVTTALDMRDARVLTVLSARTGRRLGAFDLRFCPALQTAELRLTPDDARAALDEGVVFHPGKPQPPVWLLSGETSGRAEVPAVLAPHLLPEGPGGTDALPRLMDRLRGLDCLAPFGWMEGCVIDGQLDLDAVRPGEGFLDAARLHLACYLDDALGISYEDPLSRPMDGALISIEETLMAAQIRRLHPGHPSLRLFESFWEARGHQHGGVATDDGMLSTEGCYTVAYPMAVAARATGSTRMASRACAELRARVRALGVGPGGSIWLRHHADGSRTYRDWCRGVAWYLLGICRTVRELGGLADTSDLRVEFRRAAGHAMRWQTREGLFRCYLDDPDTGPDTAGSAGIAAALAMGAVTGILAPDARDAARAAVRGVLTHLTPDGMLGGVSQSNRGGETLQRSDYRVISPIAMGLLAQAIAWTEGDPGHDPGQRG